MFRIRSIWAISALVLCAAFAGCGSINQFGSGSQNTGNSSVVIVMTDTPPSNVTILSAQVTLTGATLTPGNVSLFSGSATVDLVRLQTDVAYLATAANIPAGNFTAVTLTFANPSLTFENDMPTSIAGCAVGSICTIVPTAMPMSATVPLTAFSIASNSTTGLLIDVNLDNLLTPSLGENFSAGTTVFPFTPAGIGAPPVGAEDVVGQVGNLNTANRTFTLTNVTGTYSLKVDSTSTFFQFPAGGACTTPAFACLQNNQILSVDIGIQSDGSILARNILFEDADNSDTEVEGIVTGTNAGSQQFDFVIQTISASVSGLSIGQHVNVQYSTPFTVFDLDLVHADNFQISTAGFGFAAPADLVVGQQVSIRRNSASTATLIKADRVRLRMTRLTATIQLGLPNIILTNLPSIFSGNGVSLITAQTSVSPPTIYYEVGQNINSSNILIGELVSVRGPMFNVGGGRTIITTKVVVKP
ncbi:MAG TPA: DUF4382 domain-containing protein [Candidatus Acidoferrum sp.]|jgi:hypothetical protein|nr:DUF4382 domain-containing protein [Candidatus Acidoferrum sp.]